MLADAESGPAVSVSAIVCAVLFLVPLVRALSGDPEAAADATRPAILGADLPANDQRQDYLRATLSGVEDGRPVVTAFTRQDSSMLGILAQAHALIVRPPHAPPAEAGEPCRYLPL